MSKLQSNKILSYLSVYRELSKPDITFLVIITSFFGYYAGICFSPESIFFNWIKVFHLMVGVALSSAGVSSLNGYLESHLDSKMIRTSNRPIPSGRISSLHALCFGLLVSILGVLELYFFINPLAGMLSILTLGLYLLIYTPLKQKTEWNTIIGAIPGALPPLGGWVAATGEINIGSWIFFGLLFTWQIPHFLSIAWIYRNDYKIAGFKMLTTGERIESKIKWYIGVFSILMIIFSILPSLIGLSGLIYILGSILLGTFFFYTSYKMMINPNNQTARKLLFASIVYYPILLMIFIYSVQTGKLNVYHV